VHEESRYRQLRPAGAIAHLLYSDRVSAKLKCPVRAKLKCPNYPSEDVVREAEIGLGDDERTRTATHRGSF